MSEMPNTNGVVSLEDQVRWCRFWFRQLLRLEEKGLVTQRQFLDLAHLTQGYNIGYGHGQIRPGTMGQWDVFQAFRQEPDVTEQQALLLAGIRSSDIGRFRIKEAMWRSAFDSSNPEDMLEFRRVTNLRTCQIDEELGRLRPFC